MKKLLIVVFITLISVSAVFYLFSYSITFFAEKGLEALFPGDEISIEGVDIYPPGYLRVSGINIEKTGEYKYFIDETAIYFSFPSLMKKTIEKVRITGLKVDIRSQDKVLADIADFKNGAGGNGDSPPFIVDELELYRAVFNIESKDLTIDAVLSISVRPYDGNVNSMSLRMPLLKKEGAIFTDVLMAVPYGMKRGRFHCNGIKIDKFKVGNIDSAVLVRPGSISLYSIGADVFSGTLDGEMDIILNEGVVYDFIIGVKNIGLNAVVKTLKWDNKIALSGLVNGLVELKGKNNDINLFEGNFDIGEGGTLRIMDEKLLSRLAASTGQPIDLIKASFEFYSYTMGELTVRKYNDDIIMNMFLDGEDGKRDLTVTLHDFQL